MLPLQYQFVTIRGGGLKLVGETREYANISKGIWSQTGAHGMIRAHLRAQGIPEVKMHRLIADALEGQGELIIPAHLWKQYAERGNRRNTSGLESLNLQEKQKARAKRFADFEKGLGDAEV